MNCPARRYPWSLPGTLFIIATPIGNLEDITYRAVRILGQCALVACEDTRQTKKLLDHYEIRVATCSLYEQNEQDRSAEVCARLEEGADVALVSDAGTPLISDPGYRLVTEALRRKLAVVPVPGPSAVTAALSAAGLATDRFCFRGFLPPRSAGRRKELESQKHSDATTIYYESPHRILDALADLAAVLPERNVVLARELTKIHEEFLRGTAEQLRSVLEKRPAVLGEFTLLIGKAEPTGAPMTAETVAAAVERYESGGMSRMDAMKAAAREFGVSKSVVYRHLTGAS